MHVVLVVAVVPGGHYDVALAARRTLRLDRRQFARGDAVGPIRQIFDRCPAQLSSKNVHHELTSLSRLDAARPGGFGRAKISERRRDRARRQSAELMTADAAIVLHQAEPVGQLDVFRDVTLTAELLGGRNLEHRIPIDRWIVLRRGCVVRRDHGGEIELLARIGIDLRRIDQAVAAHPDFIVCLRQIGHDIAALIVSDDHAGKAGRQFLGLRDHPHAGFRPVRTAHDAADVVALDRHRCLRVRPRPPQSPRYQCSCCKDRGCERNTIYASSS